MALINWTEDRNVMVVCILLQRLRNFLRRQRQISRPDVEGNEKSVF